MNPKEILEKVKKEIRELGTSPLDAVVSLKREEDGYLVAVELLEREAIPDTMDVLGLYELHLDTEGNITEFNRIRLRKRMDTSDTED